MKRVAGQAELVRQLALVSIKGPLNNDDISALFRGPLNIHEMPAINRPDYLRLACIADLLHNKKPIISLFMFFSLFTP